MPFWNCLCKQPENSLQLNLFQMWFSWIQNRMINELSSALKYCRICCSLAIVFIPNMKSDNGGLWWISNGIFHYVAVWDLRSDPEHKESFISPDTHQYIKTEACRWTWRSWGSWSARFSLRTFWSCCSWYSWDSWLPQVTLIETKKNYEGRKHACIGKQSPDTGDPFY